MEYIACQNLNIRKLIKMQKNLFEDIDIKLLYGIKCSENNLNTQTFLERLKLQTESAFINRKFA